MRARVPLTKILTFSLLLLLGDLRSAVAQDSVIIGKDYFLFHRPEIIQSADEAGINTSLDLIQRFSKVLSANGIALAYAVVPLKMRIYADFLPGQASLTLTWPQVTNV